MSISRKDSLEVEKFLETMERVLPHAPHSQYLQKLFCDLEAHIEAETNLIIDRSDHFNKKRGEISTDVGVRKSKQRTYSLSIPGAVSFCADYCETDVAEIFVRCLVLGADGSIPVRFRTTEDKKVIEQKLAQFSKTVKSLLKQLEE